MTNNPPNLTEQLQAMVERYEQLTKEAFKVAVSAPSHDERTTIIFDMVSRYIHDASYFAEKGDNLRALAALSYAHGWLDCGARLKLFEVYDDRLFTVDGKQ